MNDTPEYIEIFAPAREHKTADRAVAAANTATMALLDAIRESLHPAHGSDWGHAGDAHHVANELLKVYASISGRDSGETFELPTDDGRMVRFTLEGF